MAANNRDIRGLKQWVCWRFEEREGKPTKVPYGPLTGEKASSTNPDTWGSYKETIDAYKERGYDGVGFVFTQEDDFCGVDLDDCIDPQTGEIERWAREVVVHELDSYTETSPSGTGAHVLLKARMPKGRNRKGRFEAYDRERYFTVTGRHLAGTPRSVESRQEQLERVTRRVFGGSTAPSANTHGKPVAAFEAAGNGLTEEEIIRKASSASNGEKFARLWAGDTSDHGSRSEADLALCGMLAFWTGGDATRMDSLFRRSGLYREKWARDDYHERPIAEALGGKTEFYRPASLSNLGPAKTRTTPTTPLSKDCPTRPRFRWTPCPPRAGDSCAGRPSP